MATAFTDEIRRVVAAANQEVIHLGHAMISTGHVLIALSEHTPNAASDVLQKSRIPADLVRKHVTEMIPVSSPRGRGMQPQTVEFKRAVQSAVDESLARSHGYVGVDHLLLSIIADQSYVACQVLKSMGADREAIRREIINSRGFGHSDTDLGR